MGIVSSRSAFTINLKAWNEDGAAIFDEFLLKMVALAVPVRQIVMTIYADPANPVPADNSLLLQELGIEGYQGYVNGGLTEWK